MIILDPELQMDVTVEQMSNLVNLSEKINILAVPSFSRASQPPWTKIQAVPFMCRSQYLNHDMHLLNVLKLH
jgi:hypothetical protein